jgi:hypothetical protein
MFPWIASCETLNVPPDLGVSPLEDDPPLLSLDFAFPEDEHAATEAANTTATTTANVRLTVTARRRGVDGPVRPRYVWLIMNSL